MNSHTTYDVALSAGFLLWDNGRTRDRAAAADKRLLPRALTRWAAERQMGWKVPVSTATAKTSAGPRVRPPWVRSGRSGSWMGDADMGSVTGLEATR